MPKYLQCKRALLTLYTPAVYPRRTSTNVGDSVKCPSIRLRDCELRRINFCLPRQFCSQSELEYIFTSTHLCLSFNGREFYIPYSGSTTSVLFEHWRITPTVRFPLVPQYWQR